MVGQMNLHQTHMMQLVDMNLEERKESMQRKKIKKTDDAVVGIVVTVLLIGLIMAVMVMINTVYVPQWIEESESIHMDEVSNQFTQLKYALDIQSTVNDSTSMTTSISLGNKEIPFFDVARTYDSLQIVENGCSLQIRRDGISSITTYTTDSIQYSSGNLYFVDQDYVYEAGALLLSQDDSSVLYGSPSILTTEYGKNLSLTFVNISGMVGKNFISGYGNYPIYTVSTNPNFQYSLFTHVKNLTILTNYPNAWRLALNESLLYSGFEYNGDGTTRIGYGLNQYGNRVVLEFVDTTNEYPNIYVREVEVSAQLAFGLVE